MTLTPYSQIPKTAIDQITEVIQQDEGGFKFNDEAGGNWNYAGMLSTHFISYFNSKLNYIQNLVEGSNGDCRIALANLSEESRNCITVELYYDKFYLPAVAIYNKAFDDIATNIHTAELSCIINCGADAYAKICADARGKTSFYDNWEDHYIQLVVDNAKAWEADALALYMQLPESLTPAPHPLRAPNLQGWINRVRRYRDAD